MSSKLSIPHLSITKAGITSLFVSAVGQVVAFVPAFGPDKQLLISAGTTVIAAVFLVANALHALVPAIGSTKLNFADVEQGVVKLVEDEVGKLNLPAIARDAASGNLSAAVQAELTKLLSSLGAQAAAAPLPVPSVPSVTSIPPSA